MLSPLFRQSSICTTNTRLSTTVANFFLLDVGTPRTYIAVSMKSATSIQVCVKLPIETVGQIDAIAAKTKAGPATTTRASLLRYWIERGIKDSARPR